MVIFGATCPDIPTAHSALTRPLGNDNRLVRLEDSPSDDTAILEEY